MTWNNSLKKIVYLNMFLYSRGVYESGDHEGFLERLEQRIKKHDGDIEKMCSHHYQGLISINQFLT